MGSVLSNASFFFVCDASQIFTSWPSQARNGTFGKLSWEFNGYLSLFLMHSQILLNMSLTISNTFCVCRTEHLYAFPPSYPFQTRYLKHSNIEISLQYLLYILRLTNIFQKYCVISDTLKAQGRFLIGKQTRAMTATCLNYKLQWLLKNFTATTSC